jgi:hypothetical protein
MAVRPFAKIGNVLVLAGGNAATKIFEPRSNSTDFSPFNQNSTRFPREIIRV